MSVELESVIIKLEEKDLNLSIKEQYLGVNDDIKKEIQCDYNNTKRDHEFCDVTNIKTEDHFDCANYYDKTSVNIYFKEETGYKLNKNFNTRYDNYTSVVKEELKGANSKLTGTNYTTHIINPKMEQHTLSNSNFYHCGNCDYKTKCKEYLVRHVSIHLGKRYKCDECNYSTHFMKNLKRHTLRHLDIKYKCDQCDFATKDKSYLKQHFSAHSGTMHKCDNCDFTTKWKYNLKQHILIHSNIVYNCNQCDFVTKDKSYLKFHTATHSDVYYNCDKCDYNTKVKRYLNRHILRHLKKL